jgi:hypothetical protein
MRNVKRQMTNGFSSPLSKNQPNTLLFVVYRDVLELLALRIGSSGSDCARLSIG